MFTFSQMQNLNELEMIVYNYIQENSEKIAKMTIRDLSEKTHVSSTTILRFCSKMDCAGFSEFKFKFKQYLEDTKIEPVDEDAAQMIDFFKKVNTIEFEEKITAAAQMIMNKERLYFVGLGTSGTLGKYGARFFSNIGKGAQYLEDPFYPTDNSKYEDTLVVALSVSGEQRLLFKQIDGFKKGKATIISITNTSNSTLAKISDFNFSYYMPSIILPEKHNITSQVPVIYILEMIARRVQKMINERKDA